LELSYSYLGNGQSDQAIAILRSALDANPTDSGILFQLGALYMGQANWDEAEQLLQRCVDNAPTNWRCASYLGGLKYAVRQSYAQAIPLLESAITNGSTDPDDWLQLGRSHYNLLRCDLAIPVLREGYTMVQSANPEKARSFRDTLS